MEGDSQDGKSRTENPGKPILTWGRFLGWLADSLSANSNVIQKGPSDRRILNGNEKAQKYPNRQYHPIG